MKVCKTCLIEKPYSEFRKVHNVFQPYCRPCEDIYKKEWSLKNKEKNKIKDRKYYEENKAYIISKSKEYYKNNKERIKERVKNYVKENKDIISKKSKERRVKSAPVFKDWYYQYQKERLKNDVSFRLRRNLASRIRNAIKLNYKTSGTVALLGCSIDELKIHIQSQFTTEMTWDDFMSGKIHIDHKIPCAAFDLMKEDDQKKCFHYTNLQPLWAKDNLKKGARLNYQCT